MIKPNKKIPLIFRLGIALLCAFFVTSYMMSGLYARYFTTDSAGDGARVARFEFSDDLSSQYEQFTAESSLMYPGCEVPMQIEIVNNSEVSLQYVVTIRNLTSNLPILLKSDGETQSTVTIRSEVIHPSSAGDLQFSIFWPKEENSVSFTRKMDVFRITVQAVQVD